MKKGKTLYETITRGGKREGSGRKPGSGKGRTVKTSSINLPPDLWDKLDALRGELTRSAWIAAKIKAGRTAYSRKELSAALNQWMIDLWGDIPKNLPPADQDKFYRDNGLIYHFICDHFPTEEKQP